MSIVKKIQNRLISFLRDKRIEKNLIANRLLYAEILSRQNRLLSPKTNLSETEFQVFSQWGDDGIIQYLINKVDISNTIFIEFGVENYTEANTRYLLMHDNWSGLVIDGSKSNIDYIKRDPIFWKYELTAVNQFITKDNINQIISDAGFSGDIGLLHIDIDGNDYWIWDAIETVKADIVIMEYNSVLGSDQKISIPYKADFVRKKAHHSLLYAGASLPALCHLADQKGYVFVGCNSNGNNAYFVLKEKADQLNNYTAKEGYVASKFREARNEQNEFMFVPRNKRKQILEKMPFVNVVSKEIEYLK